MPRLWASPGPTLIERASKPSRHRGSYRKPEDVSLLAELRPIIDQRPTYGYTFWDYFRNAFGRDAGLRIDHLLLAPVVSDRLAAAGVDRHVRGWEKSSDHAPTWITLKD